MEIGQREFQIHFHKLTKDGNRYEVYRGRGGKRELLGTWVPINLGEVLSGTKETYQDVVRGDMSVKKDTFEDLKKRFDVRGDRDDVVEVAKGIEPVEVKGCTKCGGIGVKSGQVWDEVVGEVRDVVLCEKHLKGVDTRFFKDV
jgi:hypothetical protein